jgi:hypothetical protein
MKRFSDIERLEGSCLRLLSRGSCTAKSLLFFAWTSGGITFSPSNLLVSWLSPASVANMSTEAFSAIADVVRSLVILEDALPGSCFGLISGKL